MTLHFRSLRVFRMERTWSGMVLILNAAAIIGLALCVGMEKCGFDEVQVNPIIFCRLKNHNSRSHSD